MFEINEIETKSILSKTQIPVADYVINPYVGCSHACVYCYARFMKRFTGHTESWGEFLDVKINSPDLVSNKRKLEGKRILLSSVTDAYLPQERKYEITRKILNNLMPHNPSINILTKSNLVLRDLDLIKQFPNCEVGFSCCTLDNTIQKKIEKRTPSVKKRLRALKKIKQQDIRNYLFISPIIPSITDWKEIIEKSRDSVDYFMFENLNVAGSVWGSMKKWLENNYPNYLDNYKEIYFQDSSYWYDVEAEIKLFCKEEGLKADFYLHH